MLLACYSTVPPAQGSRPVSLRDAQAWQQLHAEADALMQKGDFGAAERVAAQALEAGRAGFGGADPNVAASFSTLGSAQLRGGRAAAAEQSFRSALEIYEKRFGANHEFTAAMLNNLGLAREQQGDMAGAELLLRRALAIKEQTLGASHPESAVTLANLARVLDRQGKSGRTGPAPVAGQADGAASPRDAGQGAALAEEKLHRDALAVQERDLGPGHPTTLATLTNLGNAMLQAGRPREAELVFRRVLAAREARLGPLHPDVAMSLNNVANALFEQSRQEEGDDAARAMRALPRRAPATGVPGRIGSEAEVLYRRALAIQQGQPGANGAAAADLQQPGGPAGRARPA